MTPEDETNLKDDPPNGLLDKQCETSKCNGISSLANSEAGDFDSTLVAEKDDENLDETLLDDAKETEEIKLDVNAISDIPTNENSEANTSTNISEQIKQEEWIENGSDHEGNTEDCTNTDAKKTENVLAEPSQTQVDEDITSTNNKNITDDTEKHVKSDATETKTYNDDNDDLLCVMDEKSIEEANAAKDESEKDDENKENEEIDQTNEESNEESNEECNEETNEETKDDEETENTESHAEMDIDASECAMDIEESDIGGVVYTDTRIESTSEHLNSSDNKLDSDKDANKENEHDSDVRSNDVTLKQHTADVPRSDSEIEESRKNITGQGKFQF